MITPPSARCVREGIDMLKVLLKSYDSWYVHILRLDMCTYPYQVVKEKDPRKHNLIWSEKAEVVSIPGRERTSSSQFHLPIYPLQLDTYTSYDLIVSTLWFLCEKNDSSRSWHKRMLLIIKHHQKKITGTCYSIKSVFYFEYNDFSLLVTYLMIFDMNQQDTIHKIEKKI